MINIIPTISSTDSLEDVEKLKESGLSTIFLLNKNSYNHAQALEMLVSQALEGFKKIYAGGVRTRELLKTALDGGAGRVVCGKLALTQPNVFSYWLECFGAETLWLCLNRKDDPSQLTTHLQSGLKTVIINACDIAFSELKDYYCKLLSGFKKIDFIPYCKIDSIEEINAAEEAGAKAVILSNSLKESKITPEELKKYYTKPNNDEK